MKKQIEGIIKEKRTEKMEGINQRYNREIFPELKKVKIFIFKGLHKRKKNYFLRAHLLTYPDTFLNS